MCSVDLYNYDDLSYEIEIEAYKKIVDAIKQVNGRYYNAKTRKYNIPKASYEELVNAVRGFADVQLKGDRPPPEPKVVNKPTPKFHMLSSDRFSVSIPYNKDAIEYFKTIRGRFGNLI